VPASLTIPSCCPDRVHALAAELGVQRVTAEVLVRRGLTDAAGARAFLDGLGPGGAMVIKAVAGGGGRGIRVVTGPDAVEEAHARCTSEAAAAFGNGAVYCERLMAPARHIEVQVLGDGTGAVAHLGERDCSIQRRHQKIVEIAPSPGLHPSVRDRIIGAALRLARHVRYDNAGTFEFLLDASDSGPDAVFAFIEANPRLQVEHTVTEEVTGVDLVEAQLRLAAGAHLSDLGLADGEGPAARGVAIQLRVNMETLQPDGSTSAPSRRRTSTASAVAHTPSTS
jgi:pyruvate carboxylase